MRRMWWLVAVGLVAGMALGVAGERWQFEDKTALRIDELRLAEAGLDVTLEELTQQVVPLAQAEPPGKPSAADGPRGNAKSAAGEALVQCLAHEADCLKLVEAMPDGVCQKFLYLQARGFTDRTVNLRLALELGELPWEELPLDAPPPGLGEPPVVSRSEYVKQALRRAQWRDRPEEGAVAFWGTELGQLCRGIIDFRQLRF